MPAQKPKDRLLKRGVEETVVSDYAAQETNSYGDFLQLKTLLNLQKTF